MHRRYQNPATKKPPKSKLFHLNPTPEDDARLKKLFGTQGSSLQEKRDQSGRSRLHMACLNKDVRLLKILLKNGVDVDVRDRSFDTPLHIAARVGAPAIAKLLIDHGANLSLRNHNGNTALHVAYTAGQIKTARVILENGTDLTAFLSAMDVNENHTNKFFTWICGLAFSFEEPVEPTEVILRPHSRAAFY